MKHLPYCALACGFDSRGTHQHAQMCNACRMTTVIVFLLVVWLVLAILGAVLEGLFWLTVVAVVLLIGTAIYGWVKRKASNV